jgi:hypothetical protein
MVNSGEDLVYRREIQDASADERAHLLEVQRTDAQAGFLSRAGNEHRQPMGTANHGPTLVNQTSSRLTQQWAGRLRIIERPLRPLQNALPNLGRKRMCGRNKQIDFDRKKRQIALATIGAPNLTV